MARNLHCGIIMKTNTTLPLAGQLQASEQWGLITCTTGREGEFIFPISFTTKCLSFIASASIPASYCTITTAKFIAHDMNYGVDYKADAFGLFIGI